MDITFSSIYLPVIYLTIYYRDFGFFLPGRATGVSRRSEMFGSDADGLNCVDDAAAKLLTSGMSAGGRTIAGRSEAGQPTIWPFFRSSTGNSLSMASPSPRLKPRSKPGWWVGHGQGGPDHVQPVSPTPRSHGPTDILRTARRNPTRCRRARRTRRVRGDTRRR